jgi:PAS domain S-box-containing protein
MKGKGTKRISITERFIWLGIGLAGLFWIIEASIHVFIFSQGDLIQQISSPAPHEIWMRAVVVVMFIAFGIYAQFITTQRRLAEEATRYAYGELNQIFNTAADGMRVVDKDHNVHRYNQTFMALSATSETDMAGRKCYEVLPGPHCHTPECPLSRVLAGEERVEHDVEKQRKDGTTVSCIVTATPFRTPDGQLLGIVEDFKDITDRKEWEESLRESEEKLAGIVDSVTDVMVMVDEQLDIVWANDVAKRLFGPDMVGNKCYAVYYRRNNVCDPCIAKQCFEDGKVHRFEKEIISPDGNLINFGCVASVAARHEDGHPRMVMKFLRDITERKQAAEQMKASLREKEVLLQEVHHRVKNNLQVISSLLKLQAGYVEDATYVDMFRESQNRVVSMSLVHEKLYQSEDLASINFSEYINHLVSALFRSYGVTIEKIAARIDVEDVVLGVDTAIPCGLIINELISNSLKYAFPGGKEGEIRVTFCSANHDEVELTVSDNGVGLPTDLNFSHPRSFGLKLVSILTDQIRGKLEIDRHRGTKFRIRFRKGRYQ